ncbi:MAG: hypothetical protein U0Y82_04690 [Thermoleophilia bacterium]
MTMLRASARAAAIERIAQEGPRYPRRLPATPGGTRGRRRGVGRSWRTWRRARPPGRSPSALRALASRPDRLAALPGVRVPTLVVVGSMTILPAEAAATLARGIPGAELHVVADAGHMAALSGREVAALVEGFLRRIDDGLTPHPPGRLARMEVSPVSEA